MRNHRCVCLLLVAVLFGCNPFAGLKGPINRLALSTEEAIALLSRTSDQLQAESQNWRDILDNTTRQLLEGSQTTISNELNNLTQRAIAATGAELRCNLDFLGIRMRDGVRRIIAQLRNEPPPPVIAHLCNVVPADLQLSLPANRRSTVSLYGFDFDLTTANTLRAFLVNQGQAPIDITQHLSITTLYLATLNVGPGTVTFTSQSQKIRFTAGDQTSEIPVVQPPVPQPGSCTIALGSQTWIPPHTRGDRDFKGHGPNVDVIAQLRLSNNSLQTRLFMRAREWQNGQPKSDHTTAEGWSPWETAYTPPSGTTIVRITSDGESSRNYIDSGHGLDRLSLPGGELVGQFECIGDTDGNEAGTRTKVTARYNSARIDCLRQ